MDQLHSRSVVVGIDGSQAAVNAAKWAVDEAISRQIQMFPSRSLPLAPACSPPKTAAVQLNSPL